MQAIKLKDSNFTLWEVEFTFLKSYKKSDFSLDEAIENFKGICDGIEPDLNDDGSGEDWDLFAEFSYYACDSGHGDNIINDCIVALSDDGINTENFNDYRYQWDKLDLSINEEYIPIALTTTGYSDLKYVKGELVGECLREFIDQCSCPNCN